MKVPVSIATAAPRGWDQICRDLSPAQVSEIHARKSGVDGQVLPDLMRTCPKSIWLQGCQARENILIQYFCSRRPLSTDQNHAPPWKFLSWADADKSRGGWNPIVQQGQQVVSRWCHIAALRHGHGAHDGLCSIRVDGRHVAAGCQADVTLAVHLIVG